MNKSINWKSARCESCGELLLRNKYDYPQAATTWSNDMQRVIIYCTRRPCGLIRAIKQRARNCWRRAVLLCRI